MIKKHQDLQKLRVKRKEKYEIYGKYKANFRLY